MVSTPPIAPSPLPPDIAEFVQSGLSITLASRDERLIPSIGKGVGCRVEDEGQRLAVMVFAEAAEALLRDVAVHRQVAVVFSRPSTNRTVQMKGRDAVAQRATPADVAAVRRYLALFAAELQPLGWDQAYVESLFWGDPAQLMVVRCTPGEGFVQTPGPAAGSRLDLAAGATR